MTADHPDSGNPEPETANIPAPRAQDDRWGLVWDVLVFQIKLGLDAFRDFLLSPLSFGALILGIFAGGDRPGRYFESVLRLGRRTEHIVNLFGSPRAPHDPHAEPYDDAQVDVLFANIEELLRRNVDSNKTAASARDKVDATIDELEARLERMRKRARDKFNRNTTDI